MCVFYFENYFCCTSFFLYLTITTQNPMSRDPLQKKYIKTLENKCIEGILDDRQIKTLLRGRYDNETISNWRDDYQQIKNLYLDICINCQYPYSDNSLTPRATELIEQIGRFIDVMNSKIIPMTLQSTEMRDAMTLLLCREKRCQNLINPVDREKSWPNMDTSFLNWVAHRLSEIGHKLLDISNSDIMGFGKPSYNEILHEVRTFMENRRHETVTFSIIGIARKCYRLEYQVRDLRYPELIPQGKGSGIFGDPRHVLGGRLGRWLGSGDYIRNTICGEGYSDSHIYRRNLAKSLSVVLSDILNSFETEMELG